MSYTTYYKVLAAEITFCTVISMGKWIKRRYQMYFVVYTLLMCQFTVQHKQSDSSKKKKLS